jgi:hypothetical protein
MEPQHNPYEIFRTRLIGLESCAKAARQDGHTPEETAAAAIKLFDLLEADAMRASGLTRQKHPQDVTEAKDRQTAILRFIQDNRLDRPRFEGWLGTFFPEVRDGGLDGLTTDHAAYILGKPEGCLKAFREFAGVASMDGGALDGQEGKPRENNG